MTNGNKTKEELTFEVIEQWEKEMTEKFDGHPTELIFQTKKAIVHLDIDKHIPNDKRKISIRESLRKLILSSEIKKYWMVGTVWVGDTTSGIRPRDQNDKKEGLIISEYKINEPPKHVLLYFNRKNGNIIWGKREVFPTGGTYPWNFYSEVKP
jgi:hypothetical protein